MRIESIRYDKHLVAILQEDAAGFTDPEEMFKAGGHVQRDGKISTRIGVGTFCVGAVLFMFKDKRLGAGLMIGAVRETFIGTEDYHGGLAIQHSAAAIDEGIRNGTIRIHPDEAPAAE